MFHGELPMMNEPTSLDSEITAGWLESVLTSYHIFVEGLKTDPDLQVKEFSVNSGCLEDESMLCDLIAVDVEYQVAGEQVQRHLIAKILPQDPFSRFFVTESRFDLREIKFYTNLLPDLHDLMTKHQEQQVDENSSLPFRLRILDTPRCIHAKYHPGCDSILVLDNLKYQGYKMGSFQKGLSLNEAQCSLAAIARVHAAGLALKEKTGTPLPDTYTFLFQPENAAQSYHNLLERGFSSVRDFLTSSERSEMLKKLEVLRDGAKQLILSLISPREPMATISHADFWCNNLMFCENEDSSMSVSILDWQMVSYSQQTNDLALLIVTSLPTKTRREEESHLLRDYWNKFTEECQLYNLDIEGKFGYSFFNLETDYKSSKRLALLLCIGSIDLALGCDETEQRLLHLLDDLQEENVI